MTTRLLLFQCVPPSILSKVMRRPYLTRWLTNEVRIANWNSLGANLDPGCYVDPRVRIDYGVDVVVGAGSALSGRIEFAAWDAITIGKRVLVNGDVHFLTASHDISDPSFAGIVRPIAVGDNAWIAQGAVILCGVVIGEGAVVGAYSVVTRDVPPRTIVAGNPARKIGERPPFEPTFIPADWKRAKIPVKPC